MNGSISQMIAEIKAAVANGTLSIAEMERRLIETINRELHQTMRAADLGLIEACQSLLLELHTHKIDTQKISIPVEPALEAKITANMAAVQARVAGRKRIRRIGKNALRIAIATAAVLALVFATEFLFLREWLGGTSTEDQQDYLVHGTVVDPGTVQSATAGEDVEFRECYSEDFAEVSSILTFEPPMPTWIPEGWTLLGYYAFAVDSQEQFAATYQKAGVQKFFTYEVRAIHDLGEDIKTYAEQNEHGIERRLENGQLVYLSMNLEIPTCIWSKDEKAFFLSAPFTEDEILQVINSIEGE